MVLKQVHERVIKQSKILFVVQTAKTEIPLDSRSQHAPRNIGRTDIDFPGIFMVKNIRLGMKRVSLVIVKPLSNRSIDLFKYKIFE